MPAAALDVHEMTCLCVSVCKAAAESILHAKAKATSVRLPHKGQRDSALGRVLQGPLTPQSAFFRGLHFRHREAQVPQWVV